MAQIYSALLAQGTALNGTDLPLWTVPAGETWVVRDIELVCSAAGSGTVEIRNGSGLAPWLRRLVVGSQDSPQWQGRVVYESGDSALIRSIGVATGFRISGYRFTG